jgi:hypothetical protein
MKSISNANRHGLMETGREILRSLYFKLFRKKGIFKLLAGLSLVWVFFIFSNVSTDTRGNAMISDLLVEQIKPEDWNVKEGGNFLNEMSEKRLNKLFRRLRAFEDAFLNANTNRRLKQRLDLFSTDRIWQVLLGVKRHNLSLVDHHYKAEINEYFKLSADEKHVEANEKFLNYLTNKSEFYSLKHPRIKVEQVDIKQVDLKSLYWFLFVSVCLFCLYHI